MTDKDNPEGWFGGADTEDDWGHGPIVVGAPFKRCMFCKKIVGAEHSPIACYNRMREKEKAAQKKKAAR